MMNLTKTIGLAVTTFGLGILLAFFLPDPALIVIESAVIVTAGFLFIKE